MNRFEFDVSATMLTKKDLQAGDTIDKEVVNAQ
jgi:hypothetical protein